MRSLLLAALFSAGAHGIMTLNDFKAIEGDRRTGIGSLPVLLGANLRGACLLCRHGRAAGRRDRATARLGSPDLRFSSSVVALLGGQAMLMAWYLKAPIARALFYSGFGVPLYVLGMMASAIAIRTFA